MLKLIGRCLRKGLLRNSSGVALTEVVVAVVVLAVILGSIPPVLLLIAKSQFSWNEQRVAESLSRNQMEYIKVATYMGGNETYPFPEYTLIDLSDETLQTYEIDVVAQPVDPETKALLFDPITKEPIEPGVYDKGLQDITVSIYHVDKLILRTNNYKVDRLDVLAL
jgi:hypothetical protein